MGEMQDLEAQEPDSHYAFTVIHPFYVPHCPEGEHETFDENGNSLGMVECQNRGLEYQPGQTVHLTESQATDALVKGLVSSAKEAADVERHLLLAAVQRAGLKLVAED